MADNDGRLSNTALGEMLGLSHASVSRIRSGDRNPSVEVMARIAELTEWSIDDQMNARKIGTYPENFELAFRDQTVPAQRGV